MGIHLDDGNDWQSTHSECLEWLLAISSIAAFSAFSFRDPGEPPTVDNNVDNAIAPLTAIMLP